MTSRVLHGEIRLSVCRVIPLPISLAFVIPDTVLDSRKLFLYGWIKWFHAWLQFR